MGDKSKQGFCFKLSGFCLKQEGKEETGHFGSSQPPLPSHGPSSCLSKSWSPSILWIAALPCFCSGSLLFLCICNFLILFHGTVLSVNITVNWGFLPIQNRLPRTSVLCLSCFCYSTILSLYPLSLKSCLCSRRPPSYNSTISY